MTSIRFNLQLYQSEEPDPRPVRGYGAKARGWVGGPVQAKRQPQAIENKYVGT